MSQNSFNNSMFRMYESYPIPLEWGGWRTDTLTLNRQGWEISGEEHYDNYMDCKILNIGACDPERKVFMRGRFNINLSRISAMGVGEILFEVSNRGFQMNMHYIKDTIQMMPELEVKSLHAMRPLDLYSSSIASYKEICMGDFEFFKYKPTKEIYIPPESVNECLDRILQLQYPEQMDIKSKLIIPESKPLVTARILTFAA